MPWLWKNRLKIGHFSPISGTIWAKESVSEERSLNPAGSFPRPMINMDKGCKNPFLTKVLKFGSV